MRYTINAWLDEGDPHLLITDADTGAVRLQWIYHRAGHSPPGGRQPPLEEGPCTGCAALHCLVNHLFLLACAGKLGSSAGNIPCPNTLLCTKRDLINETASRREKSAVPLAHMPPPDLNQRS